MWYKFSVTRKRDSKSLFYKLTEWAVYFKPWILQLKRKRWWQHSLKIPSLILKVTNFYFDYQSGKCFLWNLGVRASFGCSKLWNFVAVITLEIFFDVIAGMRRDWRVGQFRTFKIRLWFRGFREWIEIKGMNNLLSFLLFPSASESSFKWSGKFLKTFRLIVGLGMHH